MATASNGAHQSSKLAVVDPPKWPLRRPCSNCLPATTAVTELTDDVNRSIGWIYCVGTAGDGPYVAVGIVASNRIVAVNALCT